jgi:hypothetical protein
MATDLYFQRDIMRVLRSLALTRMQSGHDPRHDPFILALCSVALAFGVGADEAYTEITQRPPGQPTLVERCE